MKLKYRIAAFALSGLIAVGGGATAAVVQLSAVATKAEAATTGPGYSGITPDGGSLVLYGAPDGFQAACMDSTADWPSGATGPANLVGALSMATGEALSGTTLQKLNYALSRWGQTGDRNYAAGLAAYVYAYTSTWAHYNGQGYNTGTHYINGNRAVLGAFDDIWNQAEVSYGVPQNNVAPTGSMSFSVDNNNYTGTLRVVGMQPGSSVNLTLTNGVFTDTGSRTKNGVGNGTYPVKGTPGDGMTSYKISARGDGALQTGFTYDANVNVYYTGSQQRIIRGGTTSPYIERWTMTASDPVARSTVFSPIVTSKVESRFVADGDTFTDTLQASVAPGSQPWRQFEDGTGLSVVTKGTMYYVGAEQPAPGAEIPADATVVGTASVTLKGPNAYKAPSILPADHKPGFYNWVWGIDSKDQSLITQANIPANYSWADQSGLEAETHVVAAKLSGVSQVRDDVIGFSHLHQDTLTVTLDEGPWPTIGGQPIPAHFQNKSYWVAGDIEPVAGDTVPADAELFHTTDVTVTEPGDYASDEFPAPPTTAGYLVNVWSIVQDGAGAGYFTDWTDGWATPGEVTRVAPPKLSTQAVKSTAIGDPFHDTLTAEEPLPAPYCGDKKPDEGEASCPNTVTFAGYLQPKGAKQPVCTPQNMVLNTGYVAETPAAEESSSPTSTPTPNPTSTPSTVGEERDPAYFYNKPTVVDALGKFDSPKIITKWLGDISWVHTFRTGDGTVIDTGKCGEPSEMSNVAEGDISSTAVATATIGQEAWDVIHVKNVIPEGATIEAMVFKQTGPGAVCDESTLVWSSGLINAPKTDTDYYSNAHKKWIPSELGRYFWVEIMRNARGEITHKGVCGAANEITDVIALAKTGSDTGAYLTIGITFGALLAGAGIVLLLVTRRTKRTTTK